MKTTVYTNPSCIQCDMTKKFLDKNDIPYDVIDLSSDAEALDMVLGLGFKAAPVVVTPVGTWSGFKVENLKAVVEKYHGARS